MAGGQTHVVVDDESYDKDRNHGAQEYEGCQDAHGFEHLPATWSAMRHKQARTHECQLLEEPARPSVRGQGKEMTCAPNQESSPDQRDDQT